MSKHMKIGNNNYSVFNSEEVYLLVPDDRESPPDDQPDDKTAQHILETLKTTRNNFYAHPFHMETDHFRAFAFGISDKFPAVRVGFLLTPHFEPYIHGYADLVTWTTEQKSYVVDQCPHLSAETFRAVHEVMRQAEYHNPDAIQYADIYFGPRMEDRDLCRMVVISVHINDSVSLLVFPVIR